MHVHAGEPHIAQQAGSPAELVLRNRRIPDDPLYSGSAFLRLNQRIRAPVHGVCDDHAILIRLRRREKRFGIFRICPRACGEILRFVKALAGFLILAQIRISGHTLGFGERNITVGNVKTEIPVVARFLAEAVEILHRSRHHFAPDLRRAWQGVEIRIEMKKLVSQLPELRKTALRDNSFAIGDVEAGAEEHHGGHDGRRGNPMPAQHFSRPVPGAAGAGADGPLIEEGAHIVRKRVHAGVALFRFFPKRPGKDKSRSLGRAGFMRLGGAGLSERPSAGARGGWPVSN